MKRMNMANAEGIREYRLWYDLFMRNAFRQPEGADAHSVSST